MMNLAANIDTPDERLEGYGRFLSAKEIFETTKAILVSNFRSLIVPWEIKVVSQSDVDVEEIPTIERMSPFDKIDEIRVRENNEEAKKLIFDIHQIPHNFIERLHARLIALFDDSKEENITEVAISPDSLRDFYDFLNSLVEANLRYPDIMISSRGNIYIQWTSEKQRFVIEFLGANRCQFVIFKLDPNEPQNLIRLTGLSSVNSLLNEIILANNVVWIFE